MTNQKKGVRSVKGWVVYNVHDESITQYWDMVDEQDIGWQFSVYPARSSARNRKKYGGTYLQIVPCTITYTLPTKIGKK